MAKCFYFVKSRAGFQKVEFSSCFKCHEIDYTIILHSLSLDSLLCNTLADTTRIRPFAKSY